MCYIYATQKRLVVNFMNDDIKKLINEFKRIAKKNNIEKLFNKIYSYNFDNN